MFAFGICDNCSGRGFVCVGRCTSYNHNISRPRCFQDTPCTRQLVKHRRTRTLNTFHVSAPLIGDASGPADRRNCCMCVFSSQFARSTRCHIEIKQCVKEPRKQSTGLTRLRRLCGTAERLEPPSNRTPDRGGRGLPGGTLNITSVDPTKKNYKRNCNRDL